MIVILDDHPETSCIGKMQIVAEDKGIRIKCYRLTTITIDIHHRALACRISVPTLS